MGTLQAMLLGATIVLTPSLLVLAFVLRLLVTGSRALR